MEKAQGQIAIGKRKRGWPTYYIRAIGPKQQLRPGEIRVSLSVAFDPALLSKHFKLDTELQGPQRPFLTAETEHKS